MLIKGHETQNEEQLFKNLLFSHPMFLLVSCATRVTEALKLITKTTIRIQADNSFDCASSEQIKGTNPR